MAKRLSIPRFLEKNTGEYSLSDRPRLPIDDLEENGTALNTVKKTLLYKTRIYKQAKRRLAEMEELRAFAKEKGEKGLQKAGLLNILREN